MTHRHAVLALALAAGLSTGTASAYSSGITGLSGNPNTNGGAICNLCHTGGITPTVVITGPTTVAIGTVNTYTLTISGGQRIAGGLDVSASDGALGATDPDTRLLSGEITHQFPRMVDAAGRVSWSFEWAAPIFPGTVTLYGAGNSVNLANAFQGDAPAAATLAIDVVGAAATPGESSSIGNPPLLVTGYDELTGNLALSYASGCETSDNAIYFGPLNQVASYGYSGEVCAIGTGGSYASFNPGAGSFFFVVVGNKSGDEGSYGLSRTTAGVQNERPPFAGNLCGVSQDLTQRCD